MIKRKSGTKMEKIWKLVSIAKECECETDIIMDIAMRETVKNDIQIHAIGEVMKQIPPIYLLFKSSLILFLIVK